MRNPFVHAALVHAATQLKCNAVWERGPGLKADCHRHTHTYTAHPLTRQLFLIRTWWCPGAFSLCLSRTLSPYVPWALHPHPPFKMAGNSAVLGAMASTHTQTASDPRLCPLYSLPPRQLREHPATATGLGADWEGDDIILRFPIRCFRTRHSLASPYTVLSL